MEHSNVIRVECGNNNLNIKQIYVVRGYMTTIDLNFKITENVFKKCLKFATDSAASSADKYARRQQSDTYKITKDIRNGKIAEVMVYETAVNVFPNLTEPDFNIYDKFDKSWAPDLKDSSTNVRVAVKSQDIESALNFGESWVFQFGNGGKFDCDTGIFNKNVDNHHYVSFVALNVAKRVGSIRAIVKVSWLHDKKLFKPMKLEKFNTNSNKLAVYYEDLIKYKNELYQLSIGDAQQTISL
jgi:hypothetical protein